jgi:lipid-binding SYLF domain-containing protein
MFRPSNVHAKVILLSLTSSPSFSTLERTVRWASNSAQKVTAGRIGEVRRAVAGATVAVQKGPMVVVAAAVMVAGVSLEAAAAAVAKKVAREAFPAENCQAVEA